MVERRANAFAAHFLMPPEGVRRWLRQEGLMKKGSPRGIWEISDAGREYLARDGT
jgi:Zn-dependent peptidase ImmA (M78 family)